MRCVYCEFEILEGNQVYTEFGVPAHWDCAAFNDSRARMLWRQKEAQAHLPDGIGRQIAEAWERELNEMSLLH